MDKIVVLQTFASREEAEIARGSLEANGIRSAVITDNTGGMDPQLTLSNGIQLRVNENDLQRAREILEFQS